MRLPVWKILVVLGLLLLSLPLYQLLTKDRAHYFESRYKFTATKLLSATASHSFPEKPANSNIVEIIDGKRSTAWDGFVTDTVSNSVEIVLGEPIKVTKLAVNFSEQNPAKDFTVDFFTGSRWQRVAEVYSHSKPYYVGYFNPNNQSEASKVRIAFTSTQEKNIQKVVDVFVYKSESRSLLESIYRFGFIHTRSVASYFFYALLFLLFVSAAGAVVVHQFFNDLDTPERLALTFLFGMLWFAALGALLIYLPVSISSLVVSINILVIILLSVKHGVLSGSIKFSRLIYSLLLFLFALICFQYVFDGEPRHNLSSQFDLYYDNSQKYEFEPRPYFSDQIVPFGTARIYLNKLEVGSEGYESLLWTNLTTDRTQLFPTLSLPFLVLFGDRLFIFQMLAVSLLISIIPAVFLLARELFGPKTASLTVFFTIMSQYLLFLSELTQLKYLTVTTITLYYYFLLRLSKTNDKRFTLLAGLSAATSILLHAYTVIFVVAGALFLIKRESFRNSLVSAFRVALIPMVVFAIWITVSFMNSKGLLTAVTLGSAAKNAANYVNVDHNSGAGSQLIQNLQDRYYSFIALFAANPFPERLDRPYGFYRLTLLGAISLTLLIPLLLGLKQILARYKKEILILIGLPFILNFAGNGAYTVWGLHLYLVPILPLLFAIASNYISNKHNLVLALVSALYLFELLYVWLKIYPELVYRVPDYFGTVSLRLGLLSCALVAVVSLFALLVGYGKIQPTHEE